MIKAAWFRRYASSERPDEFDRVVQSWDTTNKASELSDFSVCTSWGSRAKTFIYCTCCANAWNIRS
jgi:phage terminase large subunit-like protein